MLDVRGGLADLRQVQRQGLQPTVIAYVALALHTRVTLYFARVASGVVGTLLLAGRASFALFCVAKSSDPRANCAREFSVPSRVERAGRQMWPCKSFRRGDWCELDPCKSFRRGDWYELDGRGGLVGPSGDATAGLQLGER